MDLLVTINMVDKPKQQPSLYVHKPGVKLGKLATWYAIFFIIQNKRIL